MGNRTKERERGLTLLEMALVVIILIILTGIVVPLVSSMIEDARIARILKTYEETSQAIRRYFADTGKIPAGLGELWENKAAQEGWAGPYLDRPLGVEDNPYNGNVALFSNLQFALEGDLALAETTSLALAFAGVPGSVAQKIDEILDEGIVTGNWRNSGRVMFILVAIEESEAPPEYSFFIYIMKQP